MSQSLKGLRKILLTLALALGIGAIFILAIGENPLAAYGAVGAGIPPYEIKKLPSQALRPFF